MRAGDVQRDVQAALDGDGRRAAPSRRLNQALLAIILIACAVAILETEPTVMAQPGLSLAFRWMNVVLAAVFLAEFLVRFWAAGADPRYRGAGGRLRFLVRPVTLIDLVALVPCLLVVGLSDSYLLRLARLLRIVVLLRLARFTRAWTVLARAIGERRYELLLSMALAGTMLLGSATLLHLSERDAQPDAFGSIPRALWWAVTTLTTVGYGDTVPVTPLGRVVAALSALMAVGVIAIPTGILAAGFSEGLQRQRRATERDRRVSRHAGPLLRGAAEPRAGGARSAAASPAEGSVEGGA